MDRAFSTFTITKADEATGTLTGIASTPDLDRHGDIVEPSGAAFSLPLPLLFSHQHDRPVGVVTAARVTPRGIEIVAKLTLSAGERVKEAWELVKSGALRGLSIGFVPKEAEPLKGGGFRFTKWSWHELSLVAVPANQNATVATVKAAAAYAARPRPLVIHPAKEGKKVSEIESRIVRAEHTAASALVPWLARVKALGIGMADDIEASVIALGAPRDLAAKLKAAVAAESTSSAPGLAGSSAYLTSFISQMRESSVLARIFADRMALAVPLHTRLMSMGLEANAAVVGEGLPIPIQGLPYEAPITVRPVKIAAALVLTRELWGDTSAAGQAFVNAQIRAAIAAASDRFLFSRLTNPGTVDLTVPTVGGLPLDGDLRAALLEVLNAVNTRAAGNLVWAVSPQAANALTLLDDPRGSLNPFGGSFLGLPAVITSGFTGSRLALIDAAAIGGNIEALEITSAGSATLEVDTAPAGGPGAVMVSLFQTNSVAVKYVLRLGLEPVMDHAAGFITFAEGGSS